MQPRATMENDPQIEEWLRRSREGNREAFDALSDRLRPWLLKAARKQIPDAELARDLVQETLLRAYRNLGKYKAERPFRNWLFTILRNLAVNHFRRRRAGSLDSTREPVRGPRKAEPGESAMRRETSAQLTESVAQLPAAYREIVVLRFIEGWTGGKIARHLNISEANVRVRLFRALVMLKEKLGERIS